MKRIIKNIGKVLLGLRIRHFLMLDAICFAIAPLLALEIRLDGIWNLAPYLQGLAVITVLCVAVKLAVLYAGGLLQALLAVCGSGRNDTNSDADRYIPSSGNYLVSTTLPAK
jgi:hypothetical protein